MDFISDDISTNFCHLILTKFRNQIPDEFLPFTVMDNNNALVDFTFHLEIIDIEHPKYSPYPKLVAFTVLIGSIS